MAGSTSDEQYRHRRDGRAVELSEEEWRRVLNINLTTVFSACKHVLPHMTQAGRGAIVNTSSIAGIRYVGYLTPAITRPRARSTN